MRISVTLALAAILTIAGRAAAETTCATDCAGSSACCDRCGHRSDCLQKTCQLVCEMKKETKLGWNVDCQEFCTLMPGHRDCCDPCPPLPRCGQEKCVKKLVRREYQVETPVYKCVVLHLCPDCCQGQAPASAGAPSPAMPPAPKAVTKLPPAPSVPVPAPTPK